MIRAAIYIRVSTLAQAQEGDSIPAQRDALLKYVMDHRDMVLVGEYIDDGISGTKYDRNELQRLLADVKSDKIDLIAVTKMDRLHRSLKNFLDTLEILDKHNCHWIAIWEPIYDTTTPQGRMITNTMMNLGQFEAEQTGQRIRQVFEYKVKQGEVLCGNQPLGYRIENKHLVPDENAPLIKEMFENYALHNNLNETTRFMASRGYPRIKHVIKSMLSNSKYIGLYRGNPNYCPPIVEKPLFDHVQRLLGQNISAAQTHFYLFTGMIKCKECGRTYSCILQTKKCRNGSKCIYQYYRCPGHYVRAELNDCTNTKVIGENKIEKILLAETRKRLSDYIFEVEEKQKIVVDNSKKIVAIQKKIDRLKELYVNEMISLDEYKNDRMMYEESIDALRSAETPQIVDLTPYRTLLNSDFENLYKELTQPQKRQFWRGIIKRLRYGNDKILEIEFL